MRATTNEHPNRAVSGETLNRLRNWFDAALELPSRQREDWLAEHVADTSDREAVRRLLEMDSEEAGFLDTPASELADRLAAVEIKPEGLIGQRIGGFLLTRALGQGGMAAVFLGERQDKDFAQRAAIKLLRRGLYSALEQRLFQRERQVLAALDHPQVARLIDGGVTDAGIPYLVMEYIDGVPITQYASEHNLSVRDRLQLFAQVCGAVQAAHRNLIVHRDIKPSNILVTELNEVKLLDFGIAKLLEEGNESATGTAGIFTPDYAAPEQVHGGMITTATDVYGLGVLLHELLTGLRPRGTPTKRPSSLLDAPTAATDPQAAWIYPVTPAQLRKILHGDLDNILLHALEAEPERRYPSAGAFADDIARYLDGRPVRAHPPTRWYRTSKFIQRHRGGVMVTAILVVAIFAALAMALWQGNIARQEARRANAMRDFMFSAFAEAKPSVPRDGPPRITEVVEKAITSARTDKHMNPAARTELLSQLTAVLRGQGSLAAALETSQWNFDQASQVLGPDSPLTLGAGHELVLTMALSGDYVHARALVDRLLSRTPAGELDLRANLLFDSSGVASKQHEQARARSNAESGLALVRQLDDPEAVANALSEYARVELATGAISGAVATYEELLRLRESQFGPSHVSVSTAHAGLSRAYRRQGRLDDAEREIRAARAIDVAVLSKDDWRNSNHLNALVMLLREQREFSAALDAAIEALRVDRIAHGDDNPETANDLNVIGKLYAELGDYADAIPPLQESLRLTEAKFGADHFETATTRAIYGDVLAHSGNVSAGEAELHHALASLEAAKEPDFEEQAETCEKLVRELLDRHDANDTLPLLDRIDVLLAKIGKSADYWQGRVAVMRATALLQLQKPELAKPLLADASAALAKAKIPDAVMRAEVPLLQAAVAREAGDSDSPILTDRARTKLAALHNPPRRLSLLSDSLGH